MISALGGAAAAVVITPCPPLASRLLQSSHHTTPPSPPTHKPRTSPPWSSANRRHLDRMSPTAGPPSTRTISAVLPPSSETGSTCATRVVSCRRWPARLLKAVPPLKTTRAGQEISAAVATEARRPGRETRRRASLLAPGVLPLGLVRGSAMPSSSSCCCCCSSACCVSVTCACVNRRVER